ncbi:MAG: nucleotide exchange factor GrpE [Saccharofermentanales bacterium]|jgi:molecular chaperone GrpE|nr:nucleotide exchange factor GrpE [Bacillota bacterium]
MTKKKELESESNEQAIDKSEVQESVSLSKESEDSKDDQSAEPTQAEETEDVDLETQYEELNDRFLRLVAEYDNFRKRTQKEKNSLYNDSVLDVCKAWLPVLDSLDRAIDAADKLSSEESKQMAEGMEMVRRQAQETMAGLGVEEMDCLGDRFDPQYQEAVAHIEDDSYGESEIIEILQKGYIKGDRVIRHCVVRVAN